MHGLFLTVCALLPPPPGERSTSTRAAPDSCALSAQFALAFPPLQPPVSAPASALLAPRCSSRRRNLAAALVGLACARSPSGFFCNVIPAPAPACLQQYNLKDEQVNSPEFLRIITEAWHNLNAADKAPYENRARADMARYLEEERQYDERQLEYTMLRKAAVNAGAGQGRGASPACSPCWRAGFKGVLGSATVTGPTYLGLACILFCSCTWPRLSVL